MNLKSLKSWHRGLREPGKGLWKKHKYLDLWSLTHFVCGLVLGSVSVLLIGSFGWSLLVVFVVMTVWELYEFKTGIIEEVPNKILDVVVGLIGFVVFYLWMYPSFVFRFNVLFLVLSVVLFLLLNIWGVAAKLKSI
tara:strand:- start:1167 stop:1574 length:408 start_codon:yes stop_codon:yes gene_type:complete